MKELIIYQFEVAFCLALFYVFYIVLLRNETNLFFKRGYFISTGIMAFVLPALHIQLSISTGEIPIEYISILPSQLIAYTPSAIQPDKVDAWMLFSILWGTGSAVMLFRLLFSLSNIGKILKETTRSPEGQSFKITNAKVQSFSFFKIIVLNAQHYHSKAMKYILAHEQAHSDQYHSLDVLLIELLKTIQWFNPFAWLFGKESLQNLEYLADQEVTNSLPNTQDYQMAIVNHSGNSASKLLRSEFSKSNLKNRIIMMNQQKNKKISTLKLMLLLPIIGVLFLSFSMKIENLDLGKEVAGMLPQLKATANDNAETAEIYAVNSLSEGTTPNQKTIKRKSTPIIKTQIKENSDTTDNHIKEVFTIVEDQPTPSTGDMDSYFQAIYKDLNYPEEEKNKMITGKVFVQFIVQKDGTLREVKAVKGMTPACDAEAVRLVKNGPLWNPGKQRGTKVDVRMILPITFGSHVETPKLRKTKYITGNVVSEAGYPIIGANVIIVGTTTGTVTDENGMYRLQLESNHKELIVSYNGYTSKLVNTSNRDDFKKVELQKYTDHSDKKQKIVVKGSKGILSELPEEDRPLLIMDEKEIEFEKLKDLNPNEIESISVLKDESATKKYGEKGKNGVIIITTKK